MRLICPNCDAQYEVDAALIPAAGRDVQCSNCGKTWFQDPDAPGTQFEQATEALERNADKAARSDTTAAAMATVGADEAVPAPEPSSGDGLSDEAAAFFKKITSAKPKPEADEPAASNEAPETAGVADEASEDTLSEEVSDPGPDVEPEPATETEIAVANAGEAESERPAFQRREVDPEALGILRAEAEREIEARRREAEAVETQGDLGLAEPDTSRHEKTGPVEARTARLRGEPEESEPGTGHRKSLLPDIDEINSTLTATSDRAVEMTETEVVAETRKRRFGFRMGFSTLLFATAALILLYLFAPQIAQSFPATAPILASYVDWANGVRQGLDSMLAGAVESLTGLLIDLSG